MNKKPPNHLALEYAAETTALKIYADLNERPRKTTTYAPGKHPSQIKDTGQFRGTLSSLRRFNAQLLRKEP